MDYYKVLLVGMSGKGKTYTFRDLDPNTTGFINVENKPLPFKNNFKHYVKAPNYPDAYKAIIEFGKNPEITCIVLDSFSAYMDNVLFEARKTKKNFEIWSMYNEEIGKLTDLLKRVPKHAFIAAHYEILGIEGNMEKRVKVKAKEWEGQVEKEFTVVLYSDSKIDPKTRKPEYFYHLFLENASAKCPPDIFGDVLEIPNNAQFMLDKINEFNRVPANV
jgi:hypothetical protein